MKVLQVNSSHPDAAIIAAAAAVLRAGGLVAFPTETVYGLGANALDPDAIERIYAAKGRPAYNPVIAHCLDVEAARGLAAEWPRTAADLAERFWPGPLTLVVRKAGHVPDRLTAGLGTVAIRVPSHPVARALLAEVGFPIAAPSANRFAELSPTTSAHVQKGLADRIDLLLDAGPAAYGIESTVVDVSGAGAALLRPGSIGEDALAEVLGAPLGRPGEHAAETPRPGPGMTARHYSPRAKLLVAPTSELGGLVPDANEGRKVGALLLGEERPAGVTHPLRMPSDPTDYARRLYAALHDLDDEECELILVEEPPRTSAWEAVRDRLARAAHQE